MQIVYSTWLWPVFLTLPSACVTPWLVTSLSTFSLRDSDQLPLSLPSACVTLTMQLPLSLPSPCVTLTSYLSLPSACVTLTSSYLPLPSACVTLTSSYLSLPSACVNSRYFSFVLFAIPQLFRVLRYCAYIFAARNQGRRAKGQKSTTVVPICVKGMVFQLSWIIKLFQPVVRR